MAGLGSGRACAHKADRTAVRYVSKGRAPKEGVRSNCLFSSRNEPRVFSCVSCQTAQRRGAPPRALQRFMHTLSNHRPRVALPPMLQGHEPAYSEAATLRYSAVPAGRALPSSQCCMSCLESQSLLLLQILHILLVSHHHELTFHRCDCIGKMQLVACENSVRTLAKKVVLATPTNS